jgi:hypothetical protein
MLSGMTPKLPAGVSQIGCAIILPYSDIYLGLETIGQAVVEYTTRH